MFAVIVAGVLLLPITRRVKAPLMFVPEKAHPLFAVTPGALEFALPAGAEVKAGDVVARLRNPDVELARAEQEGRVRELQTRLEQLRTLQAVMPAAARLIPTAAAEFADAEAQLAEHESLVASLTIRAPAAGRMLAPPERAAQRRSADMLIEWSGSPLDERNRGAWIELGTPLAIVAEPGPWTAWAGVEQSDIPAVEVGQPVRALADDLPTEILSGKVIEVARRARANETETAAAPSQRKLSSGDSRYHVVQISIDATDAGLLPGLRGTAKIATYRSTLGALMVDELRRTFQRVF
jgi:putative peptide zinc metalloprotease protein